MKRRAWDLKSRRLYLILDTDVCDGEQLFRILKQAVRNGVDIVQLRSKKGTSREILRFVERSLHYLKGQVPFIVNDRLDLALAAGADGVHLGQDDLPVRLARQIVGPRFLIGASCQTVAQARQAQREGADYVGFGSVFKTLTKPERSPMNLLLLKRAISSVHIPIFPIGGIQLENIKQVTDFGVTRVAVTRALCLAEDVVRASQLFSQALARGAERSR